MATNLGFPEHIVADAKDVEGLLPAVDIRAVSKAFVVEGRNFLVGVQGPFAGFGSDFISHTPLYDAPFVETFDVEGEVFIFTRFGVFQYDPLEITYSSLFTFDASAQIWPWSHAIVGGKHYFAHIAVGVISYDPDSSAWGNLSDSVWMPESACAVTQSNGRLVILGADRYIWSALDDGTDLEPSLATGAGFQLTALIGGTSYRVHEVQDGIIVGTSAGFMKGTFIGGQAVFRHTILRREYVMINPFCSAIIDNARVIILDQKGLFVTSGGQFTDLDPLFNEFLATDLIERFNPAREAAFRLHYSQEEQLFFMSVSEVENTHKYNYAYCMRLTVKKWGIFNEVHYGFGRFATRFGPARGTIFGYLCDQGEAANVDLGDDVGFATALNNASHTERRPNQVGNLLYFYQPLVQIPTSVQTDTDGNAVYIVSSSMKMTSIDESELIDQSLPAGWYIDAETVPVQFAQNLEGLNSYVRIGLFKFQERKYPDEVGIVTEVAIGAGYFPVGQEHEDWMLLDGAEDWNVLDGEEDWGKDILSQESFIARIYSSDDGQTIREELLLEAYDEAGGQTFYETGDGIAGVYFFVELAAEEVNEIYSMKLCQLSGTICGRL